MDPNDTARLSPNFFARDTETVARDLLGAILWRRDGSGVCAGRIVEAEGYLPEGDDASHAAWSKRGRSIMLRTPGTVYMYRAYGIHDMFNIVTESPGTAGAVLIRAVEPISGLDLMRRRRGLQRSENLCSGPGKLCQAFGFTLDMNGIDLTSCRDIWIADGFPPREIGAGPRIGISRSADLPLRFFEIGNPYVSSHRQGIHLVD